MVQIIKNILIHIFLFLLGTIGFIASFHINLLNQVDVFFYRGLLLILLWGIVISVLMFLIKKHHFSDILSVKDIILLFVLFCSVHVVLFTHLPVTAERSISVFMLGHMADNRDKSFTREEIEDFFIEKYVKEYGAFEKRFHEQEVTGTIEEISTGKYEISERGQVLMKLYDLIADWFNIDKDLIHPN